MQLYTGILPKTCANFKALCTSGMDRSKEIDVALSYMNSIFHRIVPKGWLQGGGKLLYSCSSELLFELHVFLLCLTCVY